MPARRTRRRRAGSPARWRSAPRPPRPGPGCLFRSPRSCALAHALAQQSGRTEDEDQDQHEERENVLVVAAEHADLAVARRTLLLQGIGKKREAADVRHITDVARAERLDDAEKDASQHGPGQVADAPTPRG